MSGEASGLRATDWSTDPGGAESDADDQGREQPRHPGGPEDVAHGLVVRPADQRQEVGEPDPRGALGDVHRREHTASAVSSPRTTHPTPPGPAPPRERARPAGAGVGHAPKVSSSWSRKNPIEAGQPKVQVPGSSLCRRSFSTNGIEVQIALPDRPSANTLGSADEL